MANFHQKLVELHFVNLLEFVRVALNGRLPTLASLAAQIHKTGSWTRVPAGHWQGLHPYQVVHSLAL